MSEILNLSQLAKHFSDEAAAWQLLERLRWPDGPVCPHCGVVGTAYYLAPLSGERKTSTGKTSYRRVWKCADCRKQFSVLVSTIFEDTKIPLSKWLMAIHLMCAGKNGVAAFELHRQLGITAKSAWHMGHRIRMAMARPPLVDKLAGVVEMDETYIGGSAKFAHGNRIPKKVAVVTLVERNGEARSQVMHTVNRENIKQVLTDHVERDAVLNTDGFPAYREPGQDFARHDVVNHADGEYVRGEAFTNSVEGYFSQLKRSVDGTHHHVSERHLDKYLAEFDMRYSTRKLKDGERTERAIRQTVGKRLRYQEPVGDKSS